MEKRKVIGMVGVVIGEVGKVKVIEKEKMRVEEEIGERWREKVEIIEVIGKVERMMMKKIKLMEKVEEVEEIIVILKEMKRIGILRRRRRRKRKKRLRRIGNNGRKKNEYRKEGGKKGIEKYINRFIIELKDKKGSEGKNIIN